MLFNSLDFAVFLPIVFALYWLIPNNKVRFQNFLILTASYLFYAWWDWRFLGLIFFSTIIDYLVGIALQKQSKANHRKLLLYLSLFVNLGALGLFKYYDFFLENFTNAFTLFGVHLNYSSLNWVLPVGISFYTFQTLSYSIDVYKGKLKPTKDFVIFAAYVAFFPQLVAGPIERAKNLLPQFQKERAFNYDSAINGLKQILNGLFKKMVIADNCAIFVDDFFSSYEIYNGSSLLLGAFFFSVQIYCDFSGYSDIAIGTSRLFGFNLMKNFDYPYFARSISEFWRKWHISLTTWFKDYLYIPLGGSRGGKFKTIWNTLIVFIVIGFWHGAQWKFMVYGFINALHFLPSIITGKSKKYKEVVSKGRLTPKLNDLFNMLKTFSFLVLVRVFFRADDLSIAVKYLSKICSLSLFEIPSFSNRIHALVVLVLIMIFFIVEWFGRSDNFAIENLGNKWNRTYRLAVYYVIIFSIFYFSAEQQQFIYFQF